MITKWLLIIGLSLMHGDSVSLKAIEVGPYTTLAACEAAAKQSNQFFPRGEPWLNYIGVKVDAFCIPVEATHMDKAKEGTGR